MKFEPDENTLFETDAPRQPIFVIKISAIPSVIYLALLGLSVMAAIHASANPENEWLSALFPIALILWSVFLALSFCCCSVCLAHSLVSGRASYSRDLQMGTSSGHPPSQHQIGLNIDTTPQPKT